MNFSERADALDFIDFHIYAFPEFGCRGEELKNELEEIDVRWFEKLRKEVRDGMLRGRALEEVMCSFAQDGIIGYDLLDDFINSLLSNGDLPEPILALEQGMVDYQKTPARIVLEIERLARLTADDVFVDIGSGLGQVVILMRLLTEAGCVGVEYEPAYHRYAEDCSRRLGLGGIELVNADACRIAYDRGTVFYLYTPFEGQMLEDVLELLRLEAEKRDIRIFTYGPCNAVVARKSWLSCRSGDFNDGYQLCEFVNI